MEWQGIHVRMSDGYATFARYWQPEHPRGAVLYLHGIQSHGLWFEASARRMAEVGCAVLQPDRRGSGRNEQERGHAATARQLLRDCVSCLDEIHRRTNIACCHIVGVSWGGKLALALRRFAAHRVQSLALIAPGIFPRVDLPALEKFRVGLSLLTAPRSLFEIPLNEPELFTANPERQAFIRDDPLRLRKVTASFLLASRRLDRYAQSVARDRRGCPLGVFLAGHDEIIDNAKTKAFVRRLAWPGREIIEYPDAHHTLEFELDPQPFFGDLVGWLETDKSD